MNWILSGSAKINSLIYTATYSEVNSLFLWVNQGNSIKSAVVYSKTKYNPSMMTRIDTDVNPYRITLYNSGKGLARVSTQLTNPRNAPIAMQIKPVVNFFEFLSFLNSFI